MAAWRRATLARVGTRGWYAPEVTTDTPRYGSEVDVWGVGLVQLDVLCQISKGESGPSGACCICVCSLRHTLVRTHWSNWSQRDNVYAALLPAPGLRLDFLELTTDLLAKEPTSRPSLTQSLPVSARFCESSKRTLRQLVHQSR